jgi:Leucine-rich repeat (LRR) protein
VHKNRISNLKGVIERLKHLETLILYDNELRDLEDVLTTLKPLSSLKQLGIELVLCRAL